MAGKGTETTTQQPADKIHTKSEQVLKPESKNLIQETFKGDDLKKFNDSHKSGERTLDQYVADNPGLKANLDKINEDLKEKGLHVTGFTKNGKLLVTDDLESGDPNHRLYQVQADGTVESVMKKQGESWVHDSAAESGMPATSAEKKMAVTEDNKKDLKEKNQLKSDLVAGDNVITTPDGALEVTNSNGKVKEIKYPHPQGGENKNIQDVTFNPATGKMTSWQNGEGHLWTPQGDGVDQNGHATWSDGKNTWTGKVEFNSQTSELSQTEDNTDYHKVSSLDGTQKTTTNDGTQWIKYGTDGTAIDAHDAKYEWKPGSNGEWSAYDDKGNNLEHVPKMKGVKALTPGGHLTIALDG